MPTQHRIPSRQEVAVALMQGPVKIGSIMTASIGCVVLVSGMTGVFEGDLTLTFPLAISACMMVIGAAMMLLGCLCYRRYFTFYMKRKREEDNEKMLKLSQRQLPHRLAMVVDGSSVLIIIVPTDGTIPEVLEWNEGEPLLPVLKMRKGLVLWMKVGVVPVNVVTMDLEHAELYPGMSPWHRFAITFAAIAATFVNIVLLVLVLSAPNPQDLEIFLVGVGAVAGVSLALAVCCGLQCYASYRRGERSHRQRQTTP